MRFVMQMRTWLAQKVSWGSSVRQAFCMSGLTGKMKNVAQALACAITGWKAWCHQESLTGWIGFSGSQAPAWEPTWRQSFCFAMIG
jgi:hypothetical protein